LRSKRDSRPCAWVEGSGSGWHGSIIHDPCRHCLVTIDPGRRQYHVSGPGNEMTCRSLCVHRACDKKAARRAPQQLLGPDCASSAFAPVSLPASVIVAQRNGNRGRLESTCWTSCAYVLHMHMRHCRCKMSRFSTTTPQMSTREALYNTRALNKQQQQQQNNKQQPIATVGRQDAEKGRARGPDRRCVNGRQRTPKCAPACANVREHVCQNNFDMAHSMFTCPWAHIM
jgi:hypothetical protein